MMCQVVGAEHEHVTYLLSCEKCQKEVGILAPGWKLTVEAVLCRACSPSAPQAYIQCQHCENRIGQLDGWHLDVSHAMCERHDECSYKACDDIAVLKVCIRSYRCEKHRYEPHYCDLGCG